MTPQLGQDLGHARVQLAQRRRNSGLGSRRAKRRARRRSASRPAGNGTRTRSAGSSGRGSRRTAGRSARGSSAPRRCRSARGAKPRYTAACRPQGAEAVADDPDGQWPFTAVVAVQIAPGSPINRASLAARAICLQLTAWIAFRDHRASSGDHCSQDAGLPLVTSEAPEGAPSRKRLVALYAVLALATVAVATAVIAQGQDEKAQPSIAGGYDLESSQPCFGRTPPPPSGRPLPDTAPAQPVKTVVRRQAVRPVRELHQRRRQPSRQLKLAEQPNPGGSHRLSGDVECVGAGTKKFEGAAIAGNRGSISEKLACLRSRPT